MAKSILVVLTDGLGNQMFQYAAAFAAARARGLSLLVDAHEGFLWDIYNRQYEMDAFCLTAPTLGKTGGRNYPRRLPHGIVRRLEARSLFQGRYYLPWLHRWVNGFAPFIGGYFQSPLYFAGVETDLRREFQLRQPPTGLAAEFARQLQHPTAVSVHIRLLHDFTSDKEGGGRQRIMNYYRAAVARVRQQVPEPRWFLFSDTKPFDPATIGLHEPVTFIPEDASRRPAVDQWLMSLARHKIITRSTFSWWAAWLGPQQGLVFAPECFLPGGGSAPSHDIYLPEWITLA